MSLMKLPPESSRLRRLARAQAAGEMSEYDYRAERRRIIQGFQTKPHRDDTQRRLLVARQMVDEITQTAIPVDAVAAAAADAAADAAAARTIGAPMVTTQPMDAVTAGRRRWRWFAALLALVLSLLAINSWGADQIPSRAEREPNPQTSPRITVTSVRMQPSMLDSQVSPVAVAEVVDAAMAEIRKRHVVSPHGFTQRELDEIGRFLNAVGVSEPNANLSPGVTQDLVALVAEQRDRRGISIAELEELATVAQSYYREQGYFLSVVVLPPQQVDNGQVRLELLPGLLDTVEVVGGEATLIENAFAALVGAPVHQNSIETRFAELKERSGLKAQLAFEPGSRPGTSKLKVEVLEQRRFLGLVRLDNHGLDRTGKARLGLQFDWMNPRSVGDSLRLNLFSSMNPSNQQYFAVAYRTPVLGERYELKAYLGNNRYDLPLGIGGLDLDGSSLLAEFELSRTHIISRRRGLRSFAQVGFHDLRWDDLHGQKLVFAQGGISGHQVWDEPKVFAQVRLGAELGHIASGDFSGQDPSYWRLDAEFFSWKPFDWSRLPGEQKIAIRATAQVSNSELPATRQLAFGGPRLNRAFDRASFLLDRGVQVGFEFRTPLPVGEVMMFLDSSYGNGENSRAARWAQLTSVGFGWSADWRERFTTAFSLALPIAGDSNEGLNDRGTRFYWTAQYAF